MQCTGNCGACATPCAATRFIERMNQQKAENSNNNSKEPKEECKEIMSKNMVKVAGCGAPTEPDHIRANAAILALERENEDLKEQLKSAGASTPLCFGLKNTTCLAFILAATALGVSIYAVSTVSKYSTIVDYANKISAEALATANKASLSAENAEKTADKNYEYLLEVKRISRSNSPKVKH